MEDFGAAHIFLVGKDTSATTNTRAVSIELYCIVLYCIVLYCIAVLHILEDLIGRSKVSCRSKLNRTRCPDNAQTVVHQTCRKQESVIVNKNMKS